MSTNNHSIAKQEVLKLLSLSSVDDLNLALVECGQAMKNEGKQASDEFLDPEKFEGTAAKLYKSTAISSSKWVHSKLKLYRELHPPNRPSQPSHQHSSPTSGKIERGIRRGDRTVAATGRSFDPSERGSKKGAILKLLESLTEEEQERLLRSVLKPKQHWGQWVVKAIFLPFTAPADFFQLIADIAQGRHED